MTYLSSLVFAAAWAAASLAGNIRRVLGIDRRLQLDDRLSRSLRQVILAPWRGRGRFGGWRGLSGSVVAVRRIRYCARPGAAAKPPNASARATARFELIIMFSPVARGLAGAEIEGRAGIYSELAPLPAANGAGPLNAR